MQRQPRSAEHQPLDDISSNRRPRGLTSMPCRLLEANDVALQSRLGRWGVKTSASKIFEC